MKTPQNLIEFAKTLIGSKYVLGAVVPKDQASYHGPFDCAEFVAYCNYQVFGILYGCDHDNQVNNADAYTGYFKRDSEKLGRVITVAEAAQIPGAIILRFPAPGAIGHVVLSQGNGKTIEANCTKYGCIESSITGRRFDIGILLPGVVYAEPNKTVVSVAPPVVYRLKNPMMHDEYIKGLQKALGIAVDGFFGNDTNKAVVNFQWANGLVVDGEIQPGGETATLLKI